MTIKATDEDVSDSLPAISVIENFDKFVIETVLELHRRRSELAKCREQRLLIDSERWLKDVERLLKETEVRQTLADMILVVARHRTQSSS